MASEFACLAAFRGLGADRVITCNSGMGAARAAAAAQDMIAAGARTLVSFGFAGALTPALEAGDLCLVREVCDATGECYSVAPVTECFYDRDSMDGGRLISTAEAIGDPATKQALHLRSGADYVDMESFAIARAAHAAGLACSVVRVVIDDASTELPLALTASVDHFGRPRLAAVLRNLMHTPSLIRPALQLAGAQRRAARGLKTASAQIAHPLRAQATGQAAGHAR